MTKKGKSGSRIFYDDEDTPEIRIKLGKKKGKKKGCAKVKVEFGDGSARYVRICEDGIEEYAEE